MKEIQVTGTTAIGTQVLPDDDTLHEHAIPWQSTEAVPPEEGTLLAVVPLPGTGKSLAIVGYAVSTAAMRDDSPPPVVDTAGIRLDHPQRRVWVQGVEVGLTFQEFELLAFLTARPATVFSRTDLLEQVWDRDLGYTSRTVDVHVSRLRRKLGPVYGRCLVTEYRVGYQFRPL